MSKEQLEELAVPFRMRERAPDVGDRLNEIERQRNLRASHSYYWIEDSVTTAFLVQKWIALCRYQPVRVHDPVAPLIEYPSLLSHCL